MGQSCGLFSLLSGSEASSLASSMSTTVMVMNRNMISSISVKTNEKLSPPLPPFQ